MQTETNTPQINQSVETQTKKQWTAPAFEIIQIRLGKLGGSPDFTPPDDFES